MPKRAWNLVAFLAVSWTILPQLAFGQGKSSTGQADPFTAQSVWVNEKTTLTVVERKGESFRAKLVIGDTIERDVSGTVKDGKVTWLAADVQPIKGGRGSDNYGTISAGRIDLEYRHPNGMDRAYTLRRKVAPASTPDPPAPTDRTTSKSYVMIWDFDATKLTPTAGEILIPAPSEEPYQKVRWEVSGVRAQKVMKVDGGRVIAVRPSGRYFRLRLTVEPTMSEIPKLTGAGPMPADALACLRDNKTFAARNPRTAKLARELKSDDPVETVKNILRWIKTNMKYHYDEAVVLKYMTPDGGTDFVLQEKRSDCGGHAQLFIGLCQQAGLPARILWGPVRVEGMSYRPKRNSRGQIEPGPIEAGPLGKDGSPSNFNEVGDFSGHAWAEVYLKGWGWIPLEPQDAATPLGRVPKGYVTFLRFKNGGWGLNGPAGMALSNVGMMNYYPHFELPEERGDSKGKGEATEPKQSPPKKN